VGCTQDTENDIVMKIELNKACGTAYIQMAPPVVRKHREERIYLAINRKAKILRRKKN
jgi:coproporphyrinogen III oxidase